MSANLDERNVGGYPVADGRDDTYFPVYVGPPALAAPRQRFRTSRWPLALVGKGVGLLAQRDPHRRTRKLEIFPQGVDEITQVGLRHGVRARAEQHETRRPRLGLRNAIQLQPPALHRRRRIGVHRLLEPAVEGSGRHPPVPYRVSLFDRAHQAVDAFAHQAGHGNDRRALEPDLGEFSPD
jgi:hypothetical protein